MGCKSIEKKRNMATVYCALGTVRICITFELALCCTVCAASKKGERQKERSDHHGDIDDHDE